MGGTVQRWNLLLLAVISPVPSIIPVIVDVSIIVPNNHGCGVGLEG
jgi:hypothetical protein